MFDDCFLCVIFTKYVTRAALAVRSATFVVQIKDEIKIERIRLYIALFMVITDVHGIGSCPIT